MASQTPAKPRCKKRNLIFLVWPINTCYSHLQTKVPKGVSLDLQEGTWTFQGMSFAIGKGTRSCFIGQTGAPIGCYDRTDIEHLEEFKSDCEWVRTRNGPAIPFD